jgi:hypothetical protein
MGVLQDSLMVQAMVGGPVGKAYLNEKDIGIIFFQPDLKGTLCLDLICHRIWRL